MSWTGKLREISESRDFDPNDFQAGAFAVGAEYEYRLITKGEQTGTLTEIGLRGVLSDKGWQGRLSKHG